LYVVLKNNVIKILCLGYSRNQQYQMKKLSKQYLQMMDNKRRNATLHSDQKMHLNVIHNYL